MTLIKKFFSAQRIRTQEINNESGQAAIEFILTFIFAIGIVFLFLGQTINLTEGYLVHYVNYMTSRVYLTQESSSNNEASNYENAKQKAQRVYREYALENFGINSTLEFYSPDTTNALFTGTTLKFEKDVTIFKAVGGSQKATLMSESFLGKEPLRITCLREVCDALTGSKTSCRNQATSMDVTLYDNGC